MPALCNLSCPPACHFHIVVLLAQHPLTLSPQVKGTTLLYGNHSSSQAELLAVAEAETASTAVWKAKRQIRRSEAAARRGAAAARGSQ